MVPLHSQHIGASTIHSNAVDSTAFVSPRPSSKHDQPGARHLRSTQNNTHASTCQVLHVMRTQPSHQHSYLCCIFDRMLAL